MSLFSLPVLAYSYDALVPHIDAMTMEVHHTKHHQGYVDKLNAAVAHLNTAPHSLKELLQSIDQLPSSCRMAIRNNGGGHFNHSLFWETLSPQGGLTPEGAFLGAIERDFSSFQDFVHDFSQAAVKLFGSGWVWLCLDTEGMLRIRTTPNQDNPLMHAESHQWHILLGFDVWEHAYYLQYQNRRVQYIEALWRIVDWKVVAQRYEQGIKS